MVLLIVLQLNLLGLLTSRCQVSGIESLDMESAAFRAQRLSEKLLKEDLQEDFSRRLTISMLMDKYRPDRLSRDDTLLLKYKPGTYEAMLNAYEAIWSDVSSFPVDACTVFYEDTWGMSRSYGGERLHEGCDIFGKKNIRGLYPICSMTDGIVEQVGWLPLGGYRIGIRAPHEGYYYYAHLDSYDREFQIGDFVSAGEVLGFMGDSGYGMEGTKGEFPVHLHLGIYIRTRNYQELSVNPYWVLRYIQDKNSDIKKVQKK